MNPARCGFVLGMRAYRVLLNAALAFALCGCTHELGCDLDGVSRDLGGAGLLDCGIAKSDTRPVDDCAVGNFQMRATFRAIYEKKDGSLEAIVHAAGDRYYALRASASGGDVERAQCKGGSVVTSGTRRFVQCDKPGAFTKACN